MRREEKFDGKTELRDIKNPKIENFDEKASSACHFRSRALKYAPFHSYIFRIKLVKIRGKEGEREKNNNKVKATITENRSHPRTLTLKKKKKLSECERESRVV